MTKPPSDFLAFLRDTAKPAPDDNLHLNITVSKRGLKRIITDAKEHEEFYSSADSELAPSAEPGATDDADDESSPSNDALRQIRDEAKRAIANLQDRRATLQVIIAIANKHLGEE